MSFHFPFQIFILESARYQQIKLELTKSEALNDVMSSAFYNSHAFLVYMATACWCVTLGCRYIQTTRYMQPNVDTRTAASLGIPGAASGWTRKGCSTGKARASWGSLWKHIWNLFARQSEKTGCVKRCGDGMRLPIFWVPGELHIAQGQAQNRSSVNIILQSLHTALWPMLLENHHMFRLRR